MNLSLHIVCALHHTVSAPTEFLFNLQATENARQRVREESLWFEGAQYFTEHADPSLLNRYVRVGALPGYLRLHYNATVDVQPYTVPVAELLETPTPPLPIEVLPDLRPSRFCEADALADFARAEFGAIPHPYARAAAICEWVREHVGVAAAEPTESAVRVMERGIGNAAGMAHLAIAAMRAAGIPARFLTGYAAQFAVPLVEAYPLVEAFVGTRWYLFDPAGLVSRTAFARIATGRDAAEAEVAACFGDAQRIHLNVRADLAGTEDCNDSVSDDGSLAVSTARLDDSIRWRGPRPLYGDFLVAA